MIFDNLSNFNRYSSVFSDVYDYLRNEDINKITVGKHIINENLFVLVNELETKPLDKIIFENHYEYIDIHIVLKGTEKYYYSNKQHLSVTKKYEIDGDYELLEGEGHPLIVSSNNFVVFFPDEAHLSGISAENSSENIKKLIFKVKI
jgi:YhcH/YjgK/YiaL family protein